mmetsp:Transcript_23061/g.55600  ORF Transcript_23061/g.55600 Transcript_23061/m.55600 type:complete len:1092 (+) Transcript_23061:578-3853(+)
MTNGNDIIGSPSGAAASVGYPSSPSGDSGGRPRPLREKQRVVKKPLWKRLLKNKKGSTSSKYEEMDRARTINNSGDGKPQHSQHQQKRQPPAAAVRVASSTSSVSVFEAFEISSADTDMGGIPRAQSRVSQAPIAKSKSHSPASQPTLITSSSAPPVPSLSFSNGVRASNVNNASDGGSASIASTPKGSPMRSSSIGTSQGANGIVSSTNGHSHGELSSVLSSSTRVVSGSNEHPHHPELQRQGTAGSSPGVKAGKGGSSHRSGRGGGSASIPVISPSVSDTQLKKQASTGGSARATAIGGGNEHFGSSVGNHNHNSPAHAHSWGGGATVGEKSHKSGGATVGDKSHGTSLTACTTADGSNSQNPNANNNHPGQPTAGPSFFSRRGKEGQRRRAVSPRAGTTEAPTGATSSIQMLDWNFADWMPAEDPGAAAAPAAANENKDSSKGTARPDAPSGGGGSPASSPTLEAGQPRQQPPLVGDDGNKCRGAACGSPPAATREEEECHDEDRGEEFLLEESKGSEGGVMLVEEVTRVVGNSRERGAGRSSPSMRPTLALPSPAAAASRSMRLKGSLKKGKMSRGGGGGQHQQHDRPQETNNVNNSPNKTKKGKKPSMLLSRHTQEQLGGGITGGFGMGVVAVVPAHRERSARGATASLTARQGGSNGKRKDLLKNGGVNIEGGSSYSSSRMMMSTKHNYLRNNNGNNNNDSENKDLQDREEANAVIAAAPANHTGNDANAAAPSPDERPPQSPENGNGNRKKDTNKNNSSKSSPPSSNNAAMSAAQPHLYAEINIPSKKKRKNPRHVMSSSPLPLSKSNNPSLDDDDDISKQGRIIGGDSNHEESDEEEEASLAMTSISSLTGRSSLFPSPDISNNIGVAGIGGLPKLASSWWAASEACLHPDSLEVRGGAAHGNNVININAAEEEDYFDYSTYDRRGDTVEKFGGSGEVMHGIGGGAEYGNYNDGTPANENNNDEDNVIGKLLGAWNEALKSTCRCFEIGNGVGVGMPDASTPMVNTSEGAKSVGGAATATGVTTAATIMMETVNDTTATIANTVLSRSNCNDANSSARKDNSVSGNGNIGNDEIPTFSEPMEI